MRAVRRFALLEAAGLDRLAGEVAGEHPGQLVGVAGLVR